MRGTPPGPTSFPDHKGRLRNQLNSYCKVIRLNSFLNDVGNLANETAAPSTYNVDARPQRTYRVVGVCSPRGRFPCQKQCPYVHRLTWYVDDCDTSIDMRGLSRLVGGGRLILVPTGLYRHTQLLQCQCRNNTKSIPTKCFRFPRVAGFGPADRLVVALFNHRQDVKKTTLCLSVFGESGCCVSNPVEEWSPNGSIADLFQGKV